MKKSFLNLLAVVVISSLALVSCDKTKKAVEEVNENTQEVAEENTQAVTAEIDSLQEQVDSLQADVTEATEGEAK